MSTTTLYNLSAVTAVISGICIILGSVLSNLMNSPKGTALNFFSTLFGLFAVTGVYLWQREPSGIFGGIAFAAVFVGLTLMMCVDYFGAFILTSLTPEDFTKLQNDQVMMVKTVSGLIFLVGEILFGISVILAGVLAPIAAVLFMVGFLFTPLRQAYPRIVVFGSVLSGTGIIWWGVMLWS